MDEYISVNLGKALKTEGVGENRIQSVLSNFSCPRNPDVENFLKNKAIGFSKHRWAQTHLVFTLYKGKNVLIGYYALAINNIVIDQNALSKNMRKRLKEFTSFGSNTKDYLIPMPLIAQLGKNFTNGYNELITGDELLKKALDQVRKIQTISSGQFTYLECENIQALLDFYSRNGFMKSGERMLDRDETDVLKGSRLIQMVKFMKA